MEYPKVIFESLEGQGWLVSDTLLPQQVSSRLYDYCQESWQAGLFHDAQIGYQHNKGANAEVRGDSIHWLDTRHPEAATQAFLTWTHGLRQILNQEFFLGLNSEEFHLARYAPGRTYKKHLDQHRDSRDRKISLVLYLNPHWANTDGGELCLYSIDDEDVEIARLLPQPGRLVIFRSDLISHEVLPARQTRWSLAGWLRTDSP